MLNYSALHFIRHRLPTPLRLSAIAVILFMLAPPAAVLFAALGKSSGALSTAALLDYIWQTMLYAICTVLLALAIALPAAWLTVMRSFRGVGVISWLLFMPLALPPYLIGYAYADFIERIIGVQIGGILAAAMVTALAVYPYIYLFARIALRQQSVHIGNAARLMGYSPLASCWLISWPLARPAVIAGTALALMETLNDIAIAEHYGVRALGLGVYDLWLNRGDLTAACRLAAVLMLAVTALLWMEEYGRRKQRQYAALCDSTNNHAAKISGGGGALCGLLLLLPFVGGFALPTLWYGILFAKARDDLWRGPFWEGLEGSLLLSSLLVLVLLAAALIAAIDKRRHKQGALMTPLSRLSQAGYALPGTVLAQGFFVIAALLSTWNINLFGGLFLVLAACACRFYIISYSAADAGMARISPQLDAAARLAGQSSWQTLYRVYAPLLSPSLATAALLIFLEGIKELPMTLILRPFDFQTLATVAYQYASDESLAQAAPAALMMAAVGACAVSVLFMLENKNRDSKN